MFLEMVSAPQQLVYDRPRLVYDRPNCTVLDRCGDSGCYWCATTFARQEDDWLTAIYQYNISNSAAESSFVRIQSLFQ